MTQPLLIEHDDGVDRVTLNRPDSLNALDPALIDALNAYFESLQRNRSTRVVVRVIDRLSRSTKGARFGPLLGTLRQRSRQAPGATGVSAGAAGAAAWVASSAAAFIDSRTRPFSSASSTFTRTTCPSLT